MLFRICLISCCLLTSSLSHAARWFEAEVLIFQQRPAPYLQEDFSLKHDAINNKRIRDIFSQAYRAQAQQACIEGDSRFAKQAFTDSLVTNSPHSNVCDNSVDYLASMDTLPVTPDVEARDDMSEIYILAPEQLQFNTQKQQLDRKGLTPILHTGWRFPEASESRAPAIKLIAGQRFNKNENVNNNEFISLIGANNDALKGELGTVPDWQLEGLIKIYVRHYLYINADLDISESLSTGDYETARFSQFKRVISGEVHYFDHPKIGMIIQIRRFNH